jgi:hypothetical protein
LSQALHAILLIVGNIYAFKSRNVPTTFQESRWIGLAMASLLQLFLMGVPVILAVADDPTARTLVMISVIFLNNFVLIAAIFFPKIHVYYFLDDGEGMHLTASNLVIGGGKHAHGTAGSHMGLTEVESHHTFESILGDGGKQIFIRGSNVWGKMADTERGECASQ